MDLEEFLRPYNRQARTWNWISLHQLAEDAVFEFQKNAVQLESRWFFGTPPPDLFVAIYGFRDGVESPLATCTEVKTCVFYFPDLSGDVSPPFVIHAPGWVERFEYGDLASIQKSIGNEDNSHRYPPRYWYTSLLRDNALLNNLPRIPLRLGRESREWFSWHQLLDEILQGSVRHYVPPTNYPWDHGVDKSVNLFPLAPKIPVASASDPLFPLGTRVPWPGDTPVDYRWPSSEIYGFWLHLKTGYSWAPVFEQCGPLSENPEAWADPWDEWVASRRLDLSGPVPEGWDEMSAAARYSYSIQRLFSKGPTMTVSRNVFAEAVRIEE